jgi:DNA (cytosine-5)-methyltransferase 1
MRVVSLFSGAGGLDLGFIRAGFEVVWANDIFEAAVDTYRRNIGDHIVCGDLGGIAAEDIPDAEIIIGGFPCQGFSIANMKRHARDGRNRLYSEFVRVLEAKRPAFFIAENVKGILSLEKGQVFQAIREDFADVGYRVSHALLNAADYGVPQRRERVFLFGVREGVTCDPSQFPPPPTHATREAAAAAGLRAWVSIGEALRGIPEPEEAHELDNHVYTKYKLRFNGYLGHREVDPDLPLPTVTARGDSRGGVVIQHHPGNHRRLSVREVAIAQSFPNNFYFCGSRTDGYRQLGNAVPPLLGEAVARAVRRVAEGNRETVFAPREARQLSLLG